MSFRDNLIYLRASHNMTQEQLAMMLGVSRQSVTKWEAEKSYPEMDKLIKLCQIFDCTLDELVQGDLTQKPQNPTDASPITASKVLANNPPADIFDYDAFMRKFAQKISNGVMLIILGTSISTLFFASGEPNALHGALLPENIAATLGFIILIAFVAISLGLFIPAGMEHSKFVRAHPFIEDFYSEQDKSEARSSFTYQLIVGIILVGIGVSIILPLSDTGLEDTLGVFLLLVFVAVGVRLIVHGGMTLSRVNIDAYNMAAGEVLTSSEIMKTNLSQDQKDRLEATNKSNRQIGAFCGMIMIMATIVGMILLFVPQCQSPLFWLAWPIGGLLCGMVSVLIKGLSSD